jgi:lysophospholipase L1-like esterase
VNSLIINTVQMKIKTTALLILALLAGCSKSTVTNPQPAAASQQPAVWFYGDSITAGYGASIPDNKWTSKLCSQKNWLEINEGTPFETLLQASENFGYTTFFGKYQKAITTKPANGKYIFIAYGVNDCGYNFADYTTDLFSTQLQTIITFANSKGWANNNIVVLCGYFENNSSWSLGFGGQTVPVAASMTRYNSFITAAQTVAKNNVGVYFVNPFNTYDATELSDTLHPNDAGYAAIAKYVASLVP